VIGLMRNVPMTITAFVTATLVVALHGSVLGQAPDAPQSFEVASVKPSPPDDGSLRIQFFGVPQAGGRWMSRNVTLEQMIRAAYPGHSLPEQVAGGPDWVRNRQFDVAAKAANEKATREELTAMARTLLVERFHLALRRTQEEVSGYALVLARPGVKGPGLKAATIDCDAVDAASVRGETISPSTRAACTTGGFGTNGPISRLAAGGVALHRVADMLARRLGTPVIDATGLQGLFDVQLEFAADSTADASGRPTLPAALEETLGLRLERRRVPIEVLVIERAELPEMD